MTRRFTAASLSLFMVSMLTSGIVPTVALAQNLLVNGAFEATVGTQLGNNLNADISPWNTGRFVPGSGAGAGVYTQGHDVIEVDGPTGPNIINNLYPQSDASAPGTGIAQHYIDPTGLDVLSGEMYRFGVWQYFTAPCDGVVTASADFASARSFNLGEISVTPVIGAEVLTSTVPAGTFLDTPDTSALNGTHNANKVVLNLQGGQGGQNWEGLSAQFPVHANQRYAFVAMPSQLAYLDNAAALLDCNPTLPSLTPSNISLTKSCTPATSAEYNGQVGQMWECSVDVTVPTAPFAGTLSVTDLYTPTSTTASEVVSSSSTSGNFDCTAGTSCTIGGANFDASGTDTLDYSIFITATELQDTYPMQNCVEGSYDDGSGNATPVAGNCVSSQWIPRSSINKTCDPIDAVPAGPLTLNCQIEVTGTDLATDSFVMAADAFAALQPVTATIAGTMMNVSSTEPWSCIDQSINTPGSIGVCELSAADMLAAGGASTINVSFAFTADQTSGQVVNCPFTDILPVSFVGAAGQRSSAPTLRAPQSNTVAGLPDNCAIIDLPTVNVTPKLEEVIVTKRCDAPQQATVQGALGYTWDCMAEISVTPTPFAGTFTLEDDASHISIGAAQFVSTSEPAACSGLQTDHLSCVFDGTTMASPHNVSYQLFTALTDTNQPIEWQNCIEGIAQTAAGDYPAVPMCVQAVIKPEIEPTIPPEFALKKGCRLGGVQEGNAFYACTIYVTQTSGVPITTPLTFDELFSTTSGTPATQYILSLQGTPAMPNGWNCQQSPFANGASCTISAVDFNATSSHRIDAYLSIPTAALGRDDFQNCAQVRIGDQIVGSADCVEIVEPPVETTFNVEKTCKASGERQIMGASLWLQPYQCTLTVTTNGVPFTGSLWLSEDLSFGPNSGASSILNITSADPWICATPPYAPAGQGTQPECSIDGAQFPASGSSTLTVDLMMNTAMETLGAENCVSVGRGKEAGQNEPLAHDCFEIAPPLDPKIDVTKTCEPAARGADGIWTANCEIIVNFEGFDPTNNHQFYIYDELGGNGPQTALSSLMPFNAMGMGGWGPSTGTPAGFNNATGMLLNYLQPDGSGSITQPYTATFSGPAGQHINGDVITNCAWVTIPTLSLRAPAGPIGDEKSCVPITFPASAVGGTGVILDPVLPSTPTGPVIGTGSVGTTKPVINLPRPNTPIPVPAIPRPILTMVKEQTGSCDADRTSQTYDCAFRLRVTNTGDGAYYGPLVLTDTGGAPGVSTAQVVSGNGWTCGAAIGNALSCSNSAVSLAPGGATYVDLRMKVKGLRKGGTFQNCAAVGVSENRTDRVALIQKLMNERGLNAGPVDGKPGQKTYSALTKLRSDLGLQDSGDFDDALFEALGLPLQKTGEVSCVSAELPVMPALPLQCNADTTVKQGETCACRYANMSRRNATSCQCVSGYSLVSGKGCVKIQAPKPAPKPKPALQCDLRSTYLRGDICACIDHKNAKNVSVTQCGCTNGLPMINGKCIPIAVKRSTPVDDVDGAEKCKVRINGFCIK